MGTNFFVGEIIMGCWSFNPMSLAYCCGQIYSIYEYPALYSLIGNIYGGNGQYSFGVPNLVGRSPIHHGQGVGLPDVKLGEHGGFFDETVTLKKENLPPHTHQVQVTGGLLTGTGKGGVSTPASNYLGKSTSDPIYRTNASTDTIRGVDGIHLDIGSSGETNPTPIPFKKPYLVIAYYIALDGVFPPRD